jgi:hypothetical protein
LLARSLSIISANKSYQFHHQQSAVSDNKEEFQRTGGGEKSGERCRSNTRLSFLKTKEGLYLSAFLVCLAKLDILQQRTHTLRY